MLEKTEGTIKNGQSRETGLATLGTQDTGQINLGKNRRGNQEWTIQRHWQHWVHKIQAEDKQKKNNSEN